ncbi:MAG: VWA domain-containing protein [Chloroflexota bacterium]|nr:VWA domain-containing protein [Chloroflexota bacterium]
MTLFRYSRWDGSQQVFPFDADDIMRALSDDLLADGDLWSALERVMQWGLDGNNGERLEGLQQLLEKLRELKQEELNRYDMSSVMDQIKEKLEEVKRLEREGIQRRLDEARGGDGQEEAAGNGQQATDEDAERQRPSGEGREPGEPGTRSATQGAQGRSSQLGQAQQSQSGEGQPGESGQPSGTQSPSPDPSMVDLLEKMAARKQHQLDMLPEDPAGQIKQLSDYEFMDQAAREKFQELLEMLKGQVMQSFFQGMQDALQGMSPEDMQRLKDMVRDLNQMLQDRMEGREPRFSEFMDKYGDYFEPGIENLDQLVESLQRRMAQMQSMMDSMPSSMRQSLESLIQQMMGDQEMRSAMAQLAASLEALMPMRQFRNRYPFRGDEPMSLQEAMSLMNRLQQMDELERTLKRAHDGDSLDNVDADMVGDLMGPEAKGQLEHLRQIAKVLEDAGYIQRSGNNYELTPRGSRKIGQKALQDIFAHLKKDGFGKHPMATNGRGGDRTDDSKSYEFGDPFLLDIEHTLMNSIQRDGTGKPIHLQPEDFEVFRTELLTSSSTVLMLDMSRSMLLRGCFLAAKKVAVALNSLIRSQYPRDNLYILGFSDAARELQPERLPQINWNEYVYGTNMQHGFMLARQMLARHKTTNKQIIVITDGEPTAYFDHGRVQFSYPPTYRTFQETLREVNRCTKDRIVINTFMLERSHYLTAFVTQMTKINKGRAFFATPDRLGEYILVDYVASKRKRLSA